MHIAGELWKNQEADEGNQEPDEERVRLRRRKANCWAARDTRVKDGRRVEQHERYRLPDKTALA